MSKLKYQDYEHLINKRVKVIIDAIDSTCEEKILQFSETHNCFVTSDGWVVLDILEEKSSESNQNKESELTMNEVSRLKINAMLGYSSSLIGKYYRWGGEGPDFDCSGLVQEALRSIGLDPKGDQTADALYEHFKEGNGAVIPANEMEQQGDLVFWPRNGKKTHVAIVLDDNDQEFPSSIIEAGGGDSKCVDQESAQKSSAFVRVRPINYRGKSFVVVRPNYE